MLTGQGNSVSKRRPLWARRSRYFCFLLFLETVFRVLHRHSLVMLSGQKIPNKLRSFSSISSSSRCFSSSSSHQRSSWRLRLSYRWQAMWHLLCKHYRSAISCLYCLSRLCLFFHTRSMVSSMRTEIPRRIVMLLSSVLSSISDLIRSWCSVGVQSQAWG